MTRPVTPQMCVECGSPTLVIPWRPKRRPQPDVCNEHYAAAILRDNNEPADNKKARPA